MKYLQGIHVELSGDKQFLIRYFREICLNNGISSSEYPLLDNPDAFGIFADREKNKFIFSDATLNSYYVKHSRKVTFQQFEYIIKNFQRWSKEN